MCLARAMQVSKAIPTRRYTETFLVSESLIASVWPLPPAWVSLQAAFLLKWRCRSGARDEVLAGLRAVGHHCGSSITSASRRSTVSVRQKAFSFREPHRPLKKAQKVAVESTRMGFWWREVEGDGLLCRAAKMTACFSRSYFWPFLTFKRD